MKGSDVRGRRTWWWLVVLLIVVGPHVGLADEGFWLFNRVPRAAIKQAAAQLEQWAASLQLLDVIPQKFSDSSYLPEALYERGWAKQNLKKLDEAVADYEQAATQSRGEVGARVLQRLAGHQDDQVGGLVDLQR